MTAVPTARRSCHAPDGEVALSPEPTNEIKDSKDLLFCRPQANDSGNCLKHRSQSKCTDHLLIVLMYGGKGLKVECPHKTLQRLS